MKLISGLILLFVLIGVVIFTPLTQMYFFSDDFVWLLDAKRDTVATLPTYFYDSHGFFYRPLTKLYFFFAWRWFGIDATGYHVVNISLHALVSLLVYFVCLKLLQYGKFTKVLNRLRFISAGAALIFFVHPIHLENIIWPSAITELFPPLFILLGLLAFMKKRESVWKVGRIWTGVIVICFLLALFSHEYSVVFPLIVLSTDIYARWILGKVSLIKVALASLKQSILFYLILFITDVGYLLLRAFAGSHWSGGDYSYNLVKFPLNFVGNLVGYLGAGLVGTQFVDIYQWGRDFGRQNILLSALIGLIASAVVGGLGFWIVRKVKFGLWSKLFLYLSFVFTVLLLPFLGLGGIAERYLYLASVPLVIGLSFVVMRISEYMSYFYEYGKSGVYWLFCFIIGSLTLFYGYLTVVDQANWQIASDFVYNTVTQFKKACPTYSLGEYLRKKSPPNRIGRAWVYQVGVEQSANIVCDKDLKIHLY